MVVWLLVGDEVWVVVGVVKQGSNSNCSATNEIAASVSALLRLHFRDCTRSLDPLAIKLRMARSGLSPTSNASMATLGCLNAAASNASINAFGRLCGTRDWPSEIVTMITGAAKCRNPLLLPTTSKSDANVSYPVCASVPAPASGSRVLSADAI